MPDPNGTIAGFSESQIADANARVAARNNKVGVLPDEPDPVNFFITGKTLPNGAICIAANAIRPHEWLLLCIPDPGVKAASHFVTWRCDRPGDGSDTRWGYYTDNLDAAYKNYLTRIEDSRR